MEITLVPSEVNGSVKAPSSKSMMQRAIAAALLSDSECTILNPSYCNDSLAAIGIAENLGAEVEKKITELKISSSHKIKNRTLDCKESGLAIRMFSPIAALNAGEIIMTGSGSLKNRPMKMIEDTLNQLGAVCKSNGGLLPLTIKGPIRGGICETDGSVSSQLLTGLLMALPLAEASSVVSALNLKSKPYIDMTLQVLEKFGINVVNDNYRVFKIEGNQKYNSAVFEVESDWSGGSFLLVAGAVNGDVTVEGLRTDSRQSDKTILTALDRAGADISISENSVRIKRSVLRSFEFDASESPDLFPPLVSLAAYCKGVTGIKGVSRLIHKESNRALALLEEFRKMNVKVEIKGDYMLITGGKVKGTRVTSHNDHRIAMAVAVAGLRADGNIIIEDPQCVAKSYPDFFDDVKALGAVLMFS